MTKDEFFEQLINAGFTKHADKRSNYTTFSKEKYTQSLVYTVAIAVFKKDDSITTAINLTIHKRTVSISEEYEPDDLTSKTVGYTAPTSINYYERYLKDLTTIEKYLLQDAMNGLMVRILTNNSHIV
jgi:hypothetical protein